MEIPPLSIQLLRLSFSLSLLQIPTYTTQSSSSYIPIFFSRTDVGEWIASANWNFTFFLDSVQFYWYDQIKDYAWLSLLNCL